MLGSIRELAVPLFGTFFYKQLLPLNPSKQRLKNRNTSTNSRLNPEAKALPDSNGLWGAEICFFFPVGLLGGSWVVISGVISPLRRVISIVTLLKLITLVITTHEPPSRVYRRLR